MTKYRVRKYKHGGWEIQYLEVVQKGKNKGKGKWKPFAYPGNLEQVAVRLLDASFSAHFPAQEVQTLLDTLKSGVAAILGALEAKPELFDGLEIDIPEAKSPDEPHWSENPYE